MNIGFALKMRKTVLSSLQCMGMQIPWHSYFPEPVVLFPSIALIVSSIVSIDKVKSGLCGLFENCWGGCKGLLCCGTCCDCGRAFSCSDGLCDCANYFSCKNCTCKEATALWQVVAIIIAAIGVIYAIFKSLAVPRVYVPKQYKDDEGGQRLMEALNEGGLRIRRYDWIPHFIFPVIAIVFSGWTLASKSARASTAALVANIVTIIVSIAAIIFGLTAFRKTPMVQIPLKKSGIKDLVALNPATNLKFAKSISKIAKRHPRLFRSCDIPLINKASMSASKINIELTKPKKKSQMVENKTTSPDAKESEIITDDEDRELETTLARLQGRYETIKAIQDGGQKLSSEQLAQGFTIAGEIKQLQKRLS